MLDFYQANSDKPTPLLSFIHDGGWVARDKKGIGVAPYLAAGISVASIKLPLHHPGTGGGHQAFGAMALARRGAGACSSLWLAFHNDMADAKDNDPIAHDTIFHN